MEPAGSGATWTGSPKGVFAGRKHHKPRLSLNNNGVSGTNDMAGKAVRATVECTGKVPRYNTSGVREREDENRTREARNRDEVEGVVATTLNFHRRGAVGLCEWCDPSACNKILKSNRRRIDAPLSTTLVNR